ncbi:MAG: gliding motility-associated C-terminal domain-containing protein [Bacteroidia bacterium]|nr:gliding motility-associated C-terminal domain-containing protein [Bacteroidia bacterium]
MRFLVVLAGLALSLPQPLHAQKEGAVWYFGQNAGLDFNLSYPRPRTDGKINTREGVATISDKEGQLLFYTDGQTVYNSIHGIMDNGDGLYGDVSSTQSSIIVPRPGSTTEFYIFTVDQAVAQYSPDYHGLNYSVVDMAQNPPFGRVTKKNVPLVDDPNILFTEKITVVKKPNGDYWIIAHQFGTWAFYEFLLNNSGISLESMPEAGSPHIIDPTDRINRGATGYLKSSPKGDFLVAAVEGQHFFELFSFNHETGEIMLIAKLPAGDALDLFAEKEAAYGVEFSPTSNYLYGSTRKGGILYQWDLTALNETFIKNSVQILRQNPNILCGALQLGFDGKIYVSLSGQPYLGVIKSPIQKKCNYTDNGASLRNNLTGEGGRAYYGLPTFLSDFFKAAEFYFENTCQNDLTRFYLSTRLAINGLPSWQIFDTTGTVSFGYAAVDAETKEGTYRFTQPGKYLIECKFTQFGTPFNQRREITIHQLPELNFPDTTSMCAGDPAQLDAGDGAFYSWRDNQNLNVERYRMVYNPGKYVVTVTHYNGCSNSDSTVVEENPVPLILDTLITFAACGTSNGSITLLMDQSPDQYKFVWTGFPDTTHQLLNLPGGVYEVKITNRKTGCSITSKLGVSNSDIPDVIIHASVTGPVCPGTVITLSAEGAPNFLWTNPDGLSASSINVTITGTTTYRVKGYSFNVEGKECFSYGDKTIEVFPVNLPMLGDLHEKCQGDTVELDGGSEYIAYKWSNDETTQFVHITQSIDTLILYATDRNHCVLTDTTKIVIKPLPDIRLGDNITQCLGSPLTLSGHVVGDQYLWSPGGETSEEISVNEPGTHTYKLTVRNNGCYNTDSIQVTIKPLPVVDLKMPLDTTICSSKPVKLYGGKGDTYLWNTGETTPDKYAGQSGTYWVTIHFDGCVNSDTVNLTIKPLPPVELGEDKSQCKAAPVLLQGGTGIHYYWSPGGDTLPVTRVNETGMYFLTITGENGCSNTDSIHVEIKPLPVVNLGQDTTICVLDSLRLNGGIGDTYLWSTRDTTSDIFIKQSGLYWVKIIFDGCVNSDSLQVTTKDKPKAELGKDTVYCTTNPVILTANQGGSDIYTWYNGANSREISVTQNGKYWVTVVSKDGCQNSDTVSIRINDPNKLVIDKVETNPVTCAGSKDGSLMIYAHGSGISYQYSIDDGLSFSDSPSFEGLYGKNIFRVLVREDKACITKYPREIIFNEPDSIRLNYHLVSPSCETCSDGEINLMIKGGTPPYSVKWSTNDTITFLSNMVLGKYLVWVTDAAKCHENALIDLTLGYPPFSIPNAFTPNGDGINEKWEIAALKDFPECLVKIFNRSGHLIWWSETGYPEPWDGIDKSGNVLPVGSYYYLIWLQSDLKPLKGSVSILR